MIEQDEIHYIVVYPNNSVCDNGIFVQWSEEDFKIHDIPIKRLTHSKSVIENGVLKITGTITYIIYPTI